MKLQAAHRLSAAPVEDINAIIKEATSRFKTKPVKQNSIGATYMLKGVGQIDVIRINFKVGIEFIPESDLYDLDVRKTVGRGETFADAMDHFKNQMSVSSSYMKQEIQGLKDRAKRKEVALKALSRLASA